MLTTQQLSNVFDSTRAVVLENEVALRARNHEQELVLTALVELITDTIENSEGAWPQPDAGCIHCTAGTVPDRFNTGPCALHKAQKLLGLL